MSSKKKLILIAVLGLLVVGYRPAGTTSHDAYSYTVQAGDSLWSIAQECGTTIEALVEANGERYPSLRGDPRSISVGWELVIAGQGDAVGCSAPVSPPSAPAPAPTATPANRGVDTEAITGEIIRLTNEERARAGLPALEVNPILMEVAQIRAGEVASSFSHYGPDGEFRAAVIARERGYQAQVFGENAGAPWFVPQSSNATPAQAGELFIGGWMNSPGHRENVLQDRFVAIGVGVYYADYRLYGVQVFASE